MNAALGTIAVSLTAVLSFASPARAASQALLNVSYDSTRELYEEIDQAFVADYATRHAGQKPDVQQSHAGSGKQARAVVDGLRADVVTLALGADIDAIVKGGLINEGWQSELSNNSSPYTSTIVFLVRKGNPKAVKDWGDLIKPDIKVITPNPKTSGGARWNFLAAWGYAAQVKGHDFSNADSAVAAEKAGKEAKEFPAFDDAKGKAFVEALFKNVPVLDSGARGSTVTFAQKGLGDVLISWENEAWLAQEEYKDQFEIVYPSVSILAEPPVAIVDKNVDERGTRALAEDYLKFLYSEPGQEIIAANHYRPRDTAVLSRYADKLPAIPLFTIDESFGGWTNAQKHFFNDGGVFDQIYKVNK